jgi:phosphonate transport system permease protein
VSTVSAEPPRSSRRPSKPRPSTFGIVLGAVVVVLTLLTLWDWEYGTGFSLRAVFDKFSNENPVISAIPDTEFGQMFSPRTRAAFVETLRLAVLGTSAGVIVAMPLALWSTRFGAPNATIRVVVRSVSNVIRAFPDILWALLFVAAVGVGALPGLLSLFFFSIAVVTKLTADTLDGIDVGPLEAANASGARHNQMLRTAVVPQILPAYASYALYAFELNLRASSVIGFVGAGGIGQRIQFFQSQNNWEAIWGIVVMFVIVVFIVDRISTLLRRRLV